METKAFDRDDLAAFLDHLPDRLNGLPLRHAIEARHPSFACDAFFDLLRDREMAVVRAADGPFPGLDAATAPFAYLRIMGTQEGQPAGYPSQALDLWANRLRDLAQRREVFLFVISGHKVANPAAAQALLDRLAKSGPPAGPSSG